MELDEKFDYSKIYYKMVGFNKSGYKYKIGLNRDPHPVNITKTCTKGGLHFTSKIPSLRQSDYGYEVALLQVPEGVRVYKHTNHHYKAQEIEIIEIYKYADFIDKFRVEIKEAGLMTDDISEGLKFIDSGKTYKDVFPEKEFIFPFVKSPTQEECRLAMHSLIDHFLFIPQEMRTRDMWNVFVEHDNAAILHMPFEWVTKEIIDKIVTGPYFGLNSPSTREAIKILQEKMEKNIDEQCMI